MPKKLLGGERNGMTEKQNFGLNLLVKLLMKKIFIIALKFDK